MTEDEEKEHLKITDGVNMTPYANYKDLVSEEDWEKYFKGKNFYYNDPLKLALLRTMENLITEMDELGRRL